MMVCVPVERNEISVECEPRKDPTEDFGHLALAIGN